LSRITQGSDPAQPWSDGKHQLAEGHRNAKRSWDVDGEFVVAATEVLNERMAAGEERS
jgi:hypothetical protein